MITSEDVISALTRSLATLDDPDVPFDSRTFEYCTSGHVYRACGGTDMQAHCSDDPLYQLALGAIISATDPDAAWSRMSPCERARYVGILTCIGFTGYDPVKRIFARVLVEKAIVMLDQQPVEVLDAHLRARPSSGVSGTHGV